MTEEDKKTEKHTSYAPYILGAFLVIATIVLVLVLTSKSDYEEGMDYLSQNRYDEALAEFYQVEAGDKNYQKAQYKINYINGVKAFNEKNWQAAEYFLKMVDPKDEYYAETQLLLDKIGSVGGVSAKEADLEHLADSVRKLKDDVITKEKEKEQEKKIQTDAEVSRKYVSQLENLSSRFEEAYQSARNADVQTKRTYVQNLNSLLSEANSVPYTAKEKNAAVLELRNVMAKWMERRIDFINMLISENSITETNNSRAMKEESDKLYALFKRQLQKTKEVLAAS